MKEPDRPDGDQNMKQIHHFPAEYERATGKRSDHWLAACAITAALMIIGGGLPQLGYMAFGIVTDTDDMKQAVEASGISPQLYIFLMYASFAGIWILTLLRMACWKEDRPLFRFLRMKTGWRELLLIFTCLILGTAANTICVLGAVQTGEVTLEPGSWDAGWVFLLFVAVVIQSGAEELACRGYLFQKLRRRYRSPLVAVLINTGLFAVLHIFNGGMNLWALLNLLAVGLLLSLLVLYFDCFWGAVLLHAGWNFTQNILFGLKNSGNEAVYSVFREKGESHSGFFHDTGFGVEGSPGAVLVLIVLILIILFIIRRKQIKAVDHWGETSGISS